MPGAGTNSVFDVTRFGAKGDGVTVDTPAINHTSSKRPTRVAEGQFGFLRELTPATPFA